jgi:hypothetical protein
VPITSSLSVIKACAKQTSRTWNPKIWDFTTQNGLFFADEDLEPLKIWDFTQNCDLYMF